MEECIYLRGISVDAPQGPYPFNSRAVTQMGQLAMRTSITMLVGENGSGKSTFLEALALKLSLPSIGGADAERDETLHALFPLSKAMRVAFVHRPRQSFFLRAEDFFNYARRLAAIRAELEAELARADAENAHRSRFAQGQARAAYAGQLDEHDARYDGDLNEMSHGESFLSLFAQRMQPQGLYLLDEPEAPLSPLRQLALVRMMLDLRGCAQFIVATHSPILMACPGATILTFDEHPPRKAAWDELEHVRILRSFMQDPRRFFDRMEE